MKRQGRYLNRKDSKDSGSERLGRKHFGSLTVAAAAGVLTLSVAGLAFGASSDGLPIPPGLTVQWWQWALSIPSSVHPLRLDLNTPKDQVDPSSAFCMVGQQGDVWFLGGSFKNVDISPNGAELTSQEQEETDTVKITRKCEIPFGKAILMPVLNGECSTAEEVAYGNPIPDAFLEKISYLRQCAKTQADAITTATAEFGPVGVPKSLAVKRMRTLVPFSIVYPPDNISSSGCRDNDPTNDFLCEPDPNPSLAQADGYWVLVAPPKPGTYELHTYGNVPDFNFALDITYSLTVVPPQEQ